MTVVLSLRLVVLMGFFCHPATFLGVLRRVLLGRRGRGIHYECRGVPFLVLLPVMVGESFYCLNGAIQGVSGNDPVIHVQVYLVMFLPA